MKQSEFLNESHLEAEEPNQPAFSHSVKLEQKAKGARITVHVSADNFADTRHKAVDLFKKVQEDLILEGIPLAPIEVKNGVKVNG
jgi:hypothetical protein